MKKICLIGKGNLTSKQEEVLKRVIGDFEISQQIQILNNPREISNDADLVVSLIMAPPLLSMLNQWRSFTNKDVYVFKMQQIGQFESRDEALKYGDVVYQKISNTGESKWVASKTVSLLKNPIVKIEYEGEIPVE